MNLLNKVLNIGIESRNIKFDHTRNLDKKYWGEILLKYKKESKMDFDFDWRSKQICASNLSSLLINALTKVYFVLAFMHSSILTEMKSFRKF